MRRSNSDLYRLLEKTEKECDTLRNKVSALESALVWCSGSSDFQDDGKARAGWLKMCAPLLPSSGGKPKS